MANTNLHDVYDNEKDTLPRSETVSGTIESVGDDRRIIGSSTNFSTEFQVGEFIYVASIDDVVRINHIQSDTVLILDEPLSSSISAGTAYKRVKKSPWRTFSWLIDTTGAASINGQSYPAESANSYPFDTRESISRVYPIIIDSTPNGNKVYITASA